MTTKEVPIDSVIVTNSSRKDFGDIDGLAESIKTVGQLQEIVCNSRMELVCGERRLKACKQLGRKTIRAYIASDLDDLRRAVSAQRDENTHRKDFTPSEGVAMGKRVEDAYRPTAEANLAEGQKAGGRPPKNSRQNLPTVSDAPSRQDDSKRTESVAASAAGVSRETYRKAKAVVKAAEKQPELFQGVVKEMDETGKVDPAYQKVKEAANGNNGSEQPKKKPRLTERRLAKVLGILRDLKANADKPTLQVCMVSIRKGINALLEELENASC